MSDKLNLSGKLDFTDIDLTAPETVIKEILSQISAQTNGIILGKIEPYNGNVVSYTSRGITNIVSSLDFGEKKIDIQTHLGKIGQELYKFECYIYTPQYEKFKFRAFFVQYGISNYPVSITLEENVAENIFEYSDNYILKCNTRDELEDLIYEIFSSKKMISVMQEIIRIAQAKKDFVDSSEDCDTANEE